MCNKDKLKEFAERIEQFIDGSAIDRRVRLVELMFGVLYSLVEADKLNYEHIETPSFEYSGTLNKLGSQIICGEFADSTWISTYYFNNSLMRLSALYHRILKVIYYERICDCEAGQNLHVYSLKKALKKEIKDIELSSINHVHDEFNQIKHGLEGMTQRKAKFEKSIKALDELINLYEKKIHDYECN